MICHFDDENVPVFCLRDISLSLFRVTQEALQNAVKHSGVGEFYVILRGSANEMQLEISDRGAGFDVEKAKLDRGLGLVSMQERAHLVHGTFTIDSRANGGTKKSWSASPGCGSEDFNHRNHLNCSGG